LVTVPGTVTKDAQATPVERYPTNSTLTGRS
jgi:hypothetical protein